MILDSRSWLIPVTPAIPDAAGPQGQFRHLAANSLQLTAYRVGAPGQPPDSARPFDTPRAFGASFRSPVCGSQLTLRPVTG